MTERFVEFRLFSSLSVLVDRQTRVEYFKTACSMVPIRDVGGNFKLSGLPKLGQNLDRATKRSYANQLKERFTKQKQGLGLFSQSYLVVDQLTTLEYYASGYQLAPLADGKKVKKSKRGRR
ncbi:hypothetical protein [Streptococcus cuniculipharyngis]|uniref:Uncharacterized protein n=1 Tax=Streptococcus cuniculipharyngis TaxID=1562651 RepID=A0A5C5SAE6_9STRE|nr:hypothetical protein [Streptococcus cuniculipharyngis]TWS96641.1 hypothetical protein FRX57_06660 [Streptococcus cuniculipharyngis]